MLPYTLPVVMVRCLLLLAEEELRHVIEVSESQKDNSQAVLPTRPNWEKENMPMLSPLRVRPTAPDWAVFER